jgi:putative membrane protein
LEWALISLDVVLILLFWVGLILLSVWLIKSLFQGGSPPGISNYEKRDTPTEILDRRFARGEITREQYEFMTSHLTVSISGRNREIFEMG